MNELAAAWAAFYDEDFAAAEEAFWQSDATPEVTREARGGLVYVYARTGRFDEARDGCEALRLEAVALGDSALEYAAPAVISGSRLYRAARNIPHSSHVAA